MPALFEYLLKANVGLLLFCAGYYFILRRLTFYTLNRIYLICAILFSAAYPLIDLSAFAERHQQLALPVQAVQVMVVNWQAPVKATLISSHPIDWWLLGTIVFFTGIFCMSIRLAMQMISLYRLIKKSKNEILYNYKIKAIAEPINPFSFWQSIYLNPQHHEPEQLQAILAHEQVHITGWHTLDILLAELSIVAYWFNPGVWLIKKAVAENIEFITDRTILRQGVDSKLYQYSLLHVALTASSPTVVNHFNFSKLKKRIIMMNRKASSSLNLTRYAFIVPLIGALLLCFTFSKANFALKVRNVVKNATSKLTHNIINSTLVSHQHQSQLRRQDTSLHKKSPIDNAVTISPSKSTVRFSVSGLNFDANKVDTSIYIIDGKVIKGQLSGIPAQNITSVQVIKGQSLSALMPGADTSKKIIVITTKSLKANNVSGAIVQSNTTPNSVRSYYNEFTYNLLNKSRPDTIIVTKNGTKVVTHGVSSKSMVLSTPDKNGKLTTIIESNDLSRFTNKPNLLLIADGKEVSLSTLQNLKPESIASIAVMNEEQAIKVYGKKGHTGALLVTTKTPVYNAFGSRNSNNVFTYTTKPNILLRQANRAVAFSTSTSGTAKMNDNDIYIIDGQTKSAPEFKSLSPAQIKSISITRDSSVRKNSGNTSAYVSGIVRVNIRKMPEESTYGDTKSFRLNWLNSANLAAPIDGQGRTSYSIATIKSNLNSGYVIIDGKPASSKQIKNLKIQDVENVKILHDSVSVAPYGDKGKNGVVLITTTKP